MRQGWESGVYRHHKGGLYQLLGIGQHTETGELMAVYVALTGADLPGPRVRIRPLHGPEGWSTPAKDGVPRFAYVGIEAVGE